ncbi:MAG: ABC transporter permease [Bdellovibrionota bacterium]
MKKERFIALRFMFKGTDRGTFSPLTLVAWVAIAVGVAAMGVLLSVMYGFESALKDRVLTAFPHIMVKPATGGEVIRDYEKWTATIAGVDGVKRVTPYLETEMILQSETRAIGAVVLGVSEAEMDLKASQIQEGALPNPEAKRAEVLVGSELARRLGLFAGAEIKLISPIETAGAMGLIPRAQTFIVSGICHTGHYEFDQQTLLLTLPDAQALLKKGEVISGWQVWGEDVNTAEYLREKISPVLPRTWVAESWAQFNAALFNSLKLEQYAMFSILSFAVLIAVMNISITLTMYVSQKKRNVGVLRALGASQKQIRSLFIWQGAFLGGVGLFLGALLTVAALVYLRYFSSYLLPDIYYDRTVPTEVRPLSILAIYGIATALIFVSTVYPAKKAMEIDPIEAIRQ